MLMALRPRATWLSIHSRWISQAEGVRQRFPEPVAGVGDFDPQAAAFPAEKPVATPGHFASRAIRRTVLGSTPTTREISRCALPACSSV